MQFLNGKADGTDSEHWDYQRLTSSNTDVFNGMTELLSP